ncbi:MAG: Predicted methyltransferase, DUF43 family [uncultured Acidimicrobiales bacterium]|uniref:Predicted methyltransferase, DUF43 family n=1 Tax=uncultured Acidimicrobiales bacterium TaxID=310071 RepID=A0A6J4IWV5_9ACTN|nr:MAG: Predicted methyltransferase, DUF43 family [uncultured Acidimicrobiales bacterium]
MIEPRKAQEPEPAPGPVGALEAVSALVSERRAVAAPLLTAVSELLSGCRSMPDLVRSSALPLRAVEALVQAFGDDLEPCGDGWRLRPDRAPRYRAALRLDARTSSNPAAFVVPGIQPLPVDLLALVSDLVARAPQAKRHLDHVAATPETVVRRALFLEAGFTLAGGRVLFVGDHDLTSLALAAVQPDADITVVDIDDDVLDHIETSAVAHGWKVRCLFADLRAALPDAMRGWADLVVTDPPYTRDGVRLFAARALESLANAQHGRLVLAYGYGDQPALGAKVEDALQELGLVYEAVHPAFNRYEGAQAVGSASNLYILRPARASSRPRGGSAASAVLYTHGTESIEAAHGDLARATQEALVEAATASGFGLTDAVGSRWASGLPEGVNGIALSERLAPPLPQPQNRPAPGAAIVDLRHDPGPLLLRVLLAVHAPAVAVLVPNRHPNLAGEVGQHRLQRSLEAKYRLRYLRSAPTNDLAIVVATRVDGEQLASGRRAAAMLTERPHSKIRNVLRDALIDAARRRGDPMTKNEARARLEPMLQGVDGDATAMTLSWNRLDAVMELLSNSRFA